MLWDPIRYDETCPSSDGACAVVIGNEESAEARLAQGHPVAWIHATALRTEPLQFSGRDQVSPQAGRDAAAALWKGAGITSPIDEIDVAEIYVPFSWFEPMWLENLGFAAEGEGWKLTEAGETAIGGRLPVNPSGGVLSSNPIGASGMIRFAESAIQVMGKARRPSGSRVRARRWATPTAAARSTTRCGWSAPTSRQRRVMKYTCSVAMGPIDHLVEIAKTAEEVGFDAIALPDSLFYMEKQSTDYPYTPDGSRMWNEDTPWVDPLIAGRRDGRGDVDAAVLHQRDEAGLAQSAAAGPSGRLGGELDQQPVRVRCRNRLGT